MKYSDIVTLATTLFSNPTTATKPIYISGPPGCGKTSLAYEVADNMGIPHDNVLIFRPSLRDPVDLMGVPAVISGRTHWNPPEELAKLQSGKHLLVIDELAQAVPMMQNALAGLMLDRFVGDLTLSDQCFVMATGNRQQDKAGATRIVSQLGNRVMHIEMETSADDWITWAIEKGLDLFTIAFLKLKQNHLFDFEPSRLTNATPRSWEFASYIPPTLPTNLYLSALSGVIPEGIAAEFVAFRQLAAKLPSIDAILLNPTGAEIPMEAEVRYALVTTLSLRTTDSNFAGVMDYVTRLPREFQTLYVKATAKQEPRVLHTKTFIAWAAKNADAFK